MVFNGLRRATIIGIIGLGLCGCASDEPYNTEVSSRVNQACKDAANLGRAMTVVIDDKKVPVSVYGTGGFSYFADNTLVRYNHNINGVNLEVKTNGQIIRNPQVVKEAEKFSLRVLEAILAEQEKMKIKALETAVKDLSVNQVN
jgi:hypothetical protein